MSVEDRHWQDIFQEMLENPSMSSGEVDARDEMQAELEGMLALSRQLQELGKETMPDADAALARARERVLQSIPAAAPAPARTTPAPLPFWQRWSLMLAPALRTVPTALLAAIFITLLLGTTIYLSGNAQPGNPLYPVKLASEKALLLLTPAEQKPQLLTAFNQKRALEIQRALERGEAVAIPYEGEVEECSGNTCIIDGITVQVPTEVAESLHPGEMVKLRVSVEPEQSQLLAQEIQLQPLARAPMIAEAPDAGEEEPGGDATPSASGQETPKAQPISKKQASATPIPAHTAPATSTPTATEEPTATKEPTATQVIAAGGLDSSSPRATTVSTKASPATTHVPSPVIAPASTRTKATIVATKKPTPRRKATRRATKPPRKKPTKQPTKPQAKATRPIGKATAVPARTPTAPQTSPRATATKVSIAGNGSSPKATPSTRKPSPSSRKYKRISGTIRRIARDHSWVRIGKTRVYLTRKTRITGKLEVGGYATAQTYMGKRKRYAASIVVTSKKSSSRRKTPTPAAKAQKQKTVSGSIRKIARNRSWILIGKNRIYLTRNTKITGQLKIGRKATARVYKKNQRWYAYSVVVKKTAKATPTPKKKTRPTNTPAPVRKATPSR